MAKDWNKQGFFSGITEDYSNYRWFKGESENPFLNDQKRPLAGSLWEYERDFHMDYLDRSDTSVSLADAYKKWKAEMIQEYLPGKSPNPFGDHTDWAKSFESGKRES